MIDLYWTPTCVSSHPCRGDLAGPPIRTVAMPRAEEVEEWRQMMLGSDLCRLIVDAKEMRQMLEAFEKGAQVVHFTMGDVICFSVTLEEFLGLAPRQYFQPILPAD